MTGILDVARVRVTPAEGTTIEERLKQSPTTTGGAPIVTCPSFAKDRFTRKDFEHEDGIELNNQSHGATLQRAGDVLAALWELPDAAGDDAVTAKLLHSS